MKWLGVDHERLLAVSTAEEAAPAALPAASADRTSTAALPEAAGGQAHRGQAAEPAVAAHLSRLQQSGTQEPSMTSPVPDAGDNDAVLKSASDSMKSALMSLVSSDETPAALKETAQQLVQHITGQQLLLSPEKTGSPFTHVTMFIPVQGTDGGQTASVHIQTRRGRKGELDAANCRLLFDLQMNTLGETIVDVHVVDRIVSLQLWNDHPAIADLLESSRGEIAESLQQAGFQLLTLKAVELPERMAQQSDTGGDRQPPGITEWAAKPYKGVDFRV
jgi:hypothetical protein